METVIAAYIAISYIVWALVTVKEGMTEVKRNFPVETIVIFLLAPIFFPFLVYDFIKNKENYV